MNARELAEKLVNSMTSDEVADILSGESASFLSDDISLELLMVDERSYKSADVIREIESLLGV